METITVSTNMVNSLAVDYIAITELFSLAEEQGRDYLFAHETYDLLKNFGAETPQPNASSKCKKLLADKVYNFITI